MLKRKSTVSRSSTREVELKIKLSMKMPVGGIAALKAACEVRTKYELDHPADCFCKLSVPVQEGRLMRGSVMSKHQNSAMSGMHKDPPGAARGPSGQTRSLHGMLLSRKQPSPRGLRTSTAPSLLPSRAVPSLVAARTSAMNKTSGLACAAMSEAVGEHVHQGLLHLRSCFTVVLRNSNGDRLTHGGDKVKVSSRGPAALHIEVFDEEDGRYRVSYHATLSGSYQLAVTCNSAPLRGSPFAITVEPSVAHAPSCVVEGDGLHIAVAGDEACFVVRACDEFGRPKIMGGERIEAVLVAEARGADEMQAGSKGCVCFETVRLAERP